MRLDTSKFYRTQLGDKKPDQHMVFAATQVGFGLFGGTAHITYEANEKWIDNPVVTVTCSHGNGIWTFSANQAAWHSSY